MRVVLILFWLAAALALLAPVIRRLTQRPLGARAALTDELVKDPVCNTYVVKSRALSRVDGGEVRYFCSAECARRAASGGSPSRDRALAPPRPLALRRR